MAKRDDRGDGAPPTSIHIEKTEKKTNWLAWVLLALGLLALLFGLSRCNREDATVAVAPEVPVSAPVVPNVVTPPLVGTSGVGTYLAGTEALPRTFVFERLNFDTAANAIRAEDRNEVGALVTTLQQYPTSRIRIVGYADARGASDANAALGKSRADSVKATLVSGGIAADRIETASGGETNPVDTNATASGQAENRRTELVVLQR